METVMPSSKMRLLTAMVIALGVANVVGPGHAAAAEAAPLLGQNTLINRDQPPLSETDPGIGDREHLRRYFLQEGFHGLRR
jgi:hypothetical protein